MARKNGAVIVDTYAIMADLTGQASLAATNILDKIRSGEVKGILHYLIIYELSYHWRKGRLPFYNEKELLDFIETYFDLTPLDPQTALKASRIKIVGDQLLKESNDPMLRHRKLSVSDATTIVLAEKYNVPILTGDADLSYVAKKLGIEIIW